MCYVDLTGVFVVVAAVEIVYEQKKLFFSLFLLTTKRDIRSIRLDYSRVLKSEKRLRSRTAVKSCGILGGHINSVYRIDENDDNFGCSSCGKWSPVCKLILLTEKEQ